MTISCWAINSSSGRERLEFLADRTLPQGKAIFTIRLSRDFWKREIALGGPELVEDVRLVLAQVVVEVAELKHLLSNFESWLDERSHFEQSIQAHAVGDQVLRLSVGRSSAFIYTSEKPTFTVDVKFGGYFSSVSSFVVDESCVRLARDSLADLLSGIDA